MRDPPDIGDSSYEPDDLDEDIVAAYEQLKEKSEGWEEHITDDDVSAQLAMMDKVNPRTGNAYTTRTIGERRRRLQRLGREVGKNVK